MELIAGCGNSRVKKVWLGSGERPAWTHLVTLDIDPDCNPDILADIDSPAGLPFRDDAFDEIHVYEVLEHLGRQGDFRSFFGTFAELYRVLKPNGLLFGTTPRWDRLWAWADPGHRRVIAPATLTFLDQACYAEEVGKGPRTDYRWLWRGDFVPIWAKDHEDSSAWICQAIKPSRLRAVSAMSD